MAVWLVAWLALVPWTGGGRAVAAPDWLSAETAARLDLGFEVLVPPYVPDPFGGEPRVEASEGYYSLYWLVPGAPPTFLEITGQVGGEIPDYSLYDRNVELQINAEVQGVPAYRDLTPIYDLVYWQIGDIVYTVNSQSMIAEDSLSLANALEVLTPPGADDGVDEGDDGLVDEEEPPVVEITLGAPSTVQSGSTAAIGVDGVDGAVLSADAGIFVETGEATYAGAGGFAVEWQAPDTDADLYVTFYLTDPESGETLATGETLVLGASAAALSGASFDCPGTAISDELVFLTLYGSGTLIIDATAGFWPAQSPNTLYDADADGGNTLVGSLPADGTATLAWRAPSVDEEQTIYIFATDLDGNTPGECAILVSPGDLPPNPTPAPPEADVAAEEDEDDEDQAAEEAPTATAAPVATATSTPRPTEEATSEATGEPSETATAAPPRPTATAGPPASPTATLAPTRLGNGLVSMEIGPEGGELVNPAGATLTVPPGALTERATVSIQPVADARLEAASNVELIPGSAFEVSVARSNGESIDQLEKPATLRLTMTAEQRREGAAIYWLHDGRVEQLAGCVLSGDGINAPLDHFSRFAIGVAVPTQTSSRNVVPWVVGGIGGLTAIVLVSVLINTLNRGRARPVLTRRQMSGRGRTR